MLVTDPVRVLVTVDTITSNGSLSDIVHELTRNIKDHFTRRRESGAEPVFELRGPRNVLLLNITLCNGRYHCINNAYQDDFSKQAIEGVVNNLNGE